MIAADPEGRAEKSAEASWQGHGVSVGIICQRLRDLWSSAQTDWRGEGRRPDIRTSVLNLIVYAADEATAHRATQAAERLSGAHPSRSIVIIAGRASGSPSIDASISIRSHGAYADYRQVCSERLTVWVHGPVSEHVHSIVIPLLAPDLPVAVWWPGNAPFEHHVFHQLRDSASRFILDSDDFPDIERDMLGLATAQARSHTRCSFSDVNWSRLAPWRDMLAQIFDVPAFRPLLDQITTVTIECRPGKQQIFSLPQALLLSGWLSACLALRPVERALESGRHLFYLAGADNRLAVELRIGAEEPAAGPVAVVRLANDGSSPPAAEFSLFHDPRSHQVTATARVDGLQPMSRSRRLAPPAEALLLFRELELFRRDLMFEQALQAAVAMLQPARPVHLISGSLVD